MNKKNIIAIIFLALILVAGITYFNFFYKRDNVVQYKEGRIQASRNNCLANDEVARHEIKEKKRSLGDSEAAIFIYINDKETAVQKNTFQIDNIRRNYHPIELYKCSIFVVRMFNYDIHKEGDQDSGYKEELWEYAYNGVGKSLVLLAEKPKEFISYFSPDFRVDPNEKYLVLEKNYLGKDDYALIIKNLATLKDVFVLNLKNVLVEHPDLIPGSFGLGSWTEDGKYLRGDIFQGALSTAYYQIKAGSWEIDIFAAPSDILAGVERVINYNNWRLAYVDIPTFTGIQEVYEQIIEKAKKEGKQKNLYLYNLITKEKIKVASADPEWRFNIKWPSDTELQYELPTGEKKIYRIED